MEQSPMGKPADMGALRAGGCRGWSLVISNPDLDPDGSQARRIVRFVGDVAPDLP